MEAEENGLTFVGPDNGLLAAAVSMLGYVGGMTMTNRRFDGIALISDPSRYSFSCSW